MSDIIIPKAPAIIKGLQPLDWQKTLYNATPEQVRLLTTQSFGHWAQFSGLDVDGRPFELDSHRYLFPIYFDEGKYLVWQKAAQLGATVYMLLRLLWYCRYHQLNAGMYFPTEQGVKSLSKARLGPIIDSNPELFDSMTHDGDTLGLKQIKNVFGKMSSLYMLYLGGKASKDSVPLDVIGFDEVRLVKDTDIDQAVERVSHSSYKIKMFLSTAGYPNADINKRFNGGTQLTWHIRCNCVDGFVPSDCFPDCIMDTGKHVLLFCPKCKFVVRDPQHGNYVAHNPGAPYNSYHVSQLCSRHISPAEIWEEYKRTTNMKEFFNAKLGRPYIDEQNQPITQGVLDASINTNLRWARDCADKNAKKNCAMGIDQGDGTAHVVIAKRAADGRKQIVHVEFVERDNPRYWVNGQKVSPFRRIHELMQEYDIRMCVIDAQPNHNEAMQFALAYPARVFLAWYGDAGQDMIKWLDKIKLKEQIRKGSKDQKIKWQVVLNRYMSMDFALRQWTDGWVQTPHPDGLTQMVKNYKIGRFENTALVKDIMWKHLRSLVREEQHLLEQEGKVDTGKIKMIWRYTQGDPHFAHAWNYCNTALERLKRMPIFTMV